ncbi:MAG: TrmH family RNA methyltransferase [Bacteroidota bacterium]
MRRLTHAEISRHRLDPDRPPEGPRTPVYGLLDGIRSLYNVGAMFRTADGALLSRLYLCGLTPHPPRIEIEKTALGATRSVPWEYHRDPLVPLRTLKKNGVRICVLEHTDASISYGALLQEDLPLCLVVGNELTGVSDTVLAEADLAVEIPMFGVKQSLNAVVAFGIVLYHLLRLHRGK